MTGTAPGRIRVLAASVTAATSNTSMSTLWSCSVRARSAWNTSPCGRWTNSACARGSRSSVSVRRCAPVKGGEKPDQRAEQNTATATVGVRWSEGVGIRLEAAGAGNAGRA